MAIFGRQTRIPCWGLFTVTVALVLCSLYSRRFTSAQRELTDYNQGSPLQFKQTEGPVRPQETHGSHLDPVRPEEQQAKQRTPANTGSTQVAKKTAGDNAKALAGEFILVRENNFPDFDGLTVRQADEKLFGHVSTMTGRCESRRRFGKQGDGGYTVCMDPPYVPTRNNCLVYSFGIHDEWSFDDAMHNELGCEVHSFDPSMSQEDHLHSPGVHFHRLGLWGEDTVNDLNWKLLTLRSIISLLGHQNRVIDYLKIDIEGAEWPVLQAMLASNSTRCVRQMVFEIHSPKPNRAPAMTVSDYAQVHKDLSRLQSQLGFRLYLEKHINGCCGDFVTLTDAAVCGRNNHVCCYELFYVNTNFQLPNR